MYTTILRAQADLTDYLLLYTVGANVALYGPNIIIIFCNDS